MSTSGVGGPTSPITQGGSSSPAEPPAVKKSHGGRIFSIGFPVTFSEISLKKAFISLKDFFKKIENHIPYFFSSKKTPPKEQKEAATATHTVFAEIKQDPASKPEKVPPKEQKTTASETEEGYEEMPPLESVEDGETVESTASHEEIAAPQTPNLGATRQRAGYRLRDINPQTDVDALRAELRKAENKQSEIKGPVFKTTREFIEKQDANTLLGDGQAADLRESLKSFVGRGEYGLVASSGSDTITMTFMHRGNPVEASVEVSKKGFELKSQNGEVIAAARDFSSLLKQLNLSSKINNSMLL